MTTSVPWEHIPTRLMSWDRYVTSVCCCTTKLHCERILEIISHVDIFWSLRKHH